MAPATTAGRSLLVVAVDGPSGSGKSTVSRRVARALDLRYLDTGAMYRAATWAVLQAGVDLTDAGAIAATVAAARIEASTDPTAPGISVDGTPVDRAIRGSAVTQAVSAVSAVPAVRAQLVAQQRELTAGGGFVVEGRDIGTVVLPDAPVKVFLTASEAARASRRHGQDSSSRPRVGANATVAPARAAALAAVQADLARRDRLDSGRTTSPLLQAPDAVALDTTSMTLDEAVAAVLALARGPELT